MDRLVDHLFVFEGDGVIRDFPGNYSQYRESLVNGKLPPLATETMLKTAMQIQPQPDPTNKRQLTFKEKREFELLEKEIADLNQQKTTITEKLNNNTTGFEELQTLSVRMAEVSRLLDEKELRWLELSEFN